MEPQARVTPEVAPAFPQVEKPSLEVSTEPVPFETVKQADPTLPKGQTKVLTAGQNGERTLLTEVSMVDGQEVRRVVESKVTKEPVSQILAVGTKEDAQPTPQPSPSPVVTAKGTQEEGHVGEAPVQPENPAYQVTEGTVTETETVILPYETEYVTDANRYTDEESLLQKGEAGSQEIRRVYKTVNGEKIGEPLSTTTETVKAPVTEKN